MGRSPCCQKVGLKRGRWTEEEDQILVKYIQDNGEGSWRALPKNAGLLRCGKSCRLRWINYLRTDLKRGNITPQEEDLIIKLHATIGNRWSLIATQLPGRTDNEIKNHWNSHLSRSINTWRRPANVTLPQHIIDNLAKLMAKPTPAAKKECKKIASITTIKDDKGGGGNKPRTTHDEIDDHNNEKLIKTTPDDGFKDITLPSNSWSTDQSLETIFSLDQNHRDLVEGVEDDYVGVFSLNEISTTTPLDHLQMPHASNEFLTIDGDGGGGAIDDFEFMNDLMKNLGTSQVDQMDTFDDPIMMNNMVNNDDDWSCWKDYGETLDQDLINHEDVGSFLIPWLWDCDDVGSSGL